MILALRGIYDDGNDGNDDGDDDHLARDDQINGGRRGPPAPRGQAKAVLSSPSGQVPSANVTQAVLTRREYRACK